MANEPTGELQESTGAPASGTPPSGAPAEPSVIDVDDNALIRVKGSEKPVKFGEHVRGFQSQFTKASQQAAQLKKQLEQRDAELQQLKAARQQAPQGQQQQDVYGALKALPYLSGQEAADVVAGIAREIQQRDRIMMGIAQKLQSMEKQFGSVYESHTNQSFDAKINGWLNAGGYPAEAADLAKEIYLAYEGDNLDEEFPQIFDTRWNQIVKAIESQKAAKVAAAKRQPFIPGKGGQTGPSKPLEIKPNASAKEIAEQLWGGWNNEVET
jgi:uncharacterized protein YukE